MTVPICPKLDYCNATIDEEHFHTYCCGVWEHPINCAYYTSTERLPREWAAELEP